ncbi:MAG: endonuclease/exonuclease/phosphatase family protein [Phycisphaerales bacterium]
MHGGNARRMPEIALTLLELKPDIVVLTEFRPAAGGQIAGVLADHGLIHHVQNNPPRGSNGLLIAARPPLREIAPISLGGVGVNSRAARRLIEIETPGLALVGIHVPPDAWTDNPADTSARERVFARLIEIASARRDRPCALVGDFNAARRDSGGDSPTPTGSASLGKLATFGYVDAWRVTNPGTTEPTWVGHDGRGVRIDHAFLSAPLARRLAACRLWHEPRLAGHSDHSIIVVDLDGVES